MYHFYIRSHSFSIMQISETGSENPFYCTMYIITCTYIHTTFFWSYSFHKNHGFYIHMLQGHPPQIGRNYYWAFFMQVIYCLKVVLKSWDESILVFQWTKEGVASSWGCHVLLFLESILFTGIEHGSSMTMPCPCPSGSKKLSIGLSYEVLLVSLTAMVHSEYEQEYQKHIVLVNKSAIHSSLKT